VIWGAKMANKRTELKSMTEFQSYSDMIHCDNESQICNTVYSIGDLKEMLQLAKKVAKESGRKVKNSTIVLFNNSGTRARFVGSFKIYGLYSKEVLK